MDTTRFDALSRLVGRRGILRGLLGIAGIGSAASYSPQRAAALAFCTERPKNAKCKKNGQCCSNDCKKKKGKKKGKCRCSELLEHCSEASDCCGHDESDTTSPECNFISGGSVTAVCCVPTGGACGSPDDCCNSTAACFEGLCALL